MKFTYEINHFKFYYGKLSYTNQIDEISRIKEEL